MGLLFLRHGPYYPNYLSAVTQKTLLYLYIAYLLLSPFYYWRYATEDMTNKPLLFLRGMKKFCSNLPGDHFPSFQPEEKVAGLFLLVKLFFLPLMINFFYYHLNFLSSGLEAITFYALILTLLLSIDTFIFVYGYALELKTLKNEVKSVEPTLFGWVVALICYPPFGPWVGKYVPWGH